VKKQIESLKAAAKIEVAGAAAPAASAPAAPAPSAPAASSAN
jgi:hypothetical protein